MNKKIYTAPSAQPILFVPAEKIAADPWQWGDWTTLYPDVTPSVQGYGDVWLKPWEYNSTDDPY